VRTIAVLMTCHNRKDQTMECLGRLYSEPVSNNISLSVYLVDDGCTDGTAEAVRKAYPTTTILKGDGSLFWCNGMRLAWQCAVQSNPDFLLWLNDDTIMFTGSLAVLMTTWDDASRCGLSPSIVVGSCIDPITSECSYGGELLMGLHPARLTPVVPDPVKTKECDTFNGNCVLIARSSFQLLGMMRQFKHAMADTDYGLRAKRKGVRIVVAPGYVAECRPHEESESWRCRALPRRERWRILLSRKGLPPGDWWRFLWTHAGMRAILYWPVPYCRVIAGR